MSIVSTNWLDKNLENVKIIDCSWHMPNVDRDPFKEYKAQHIKNAIFFDIDKNSNPNSNLPHMLTDKNSWEKLVSLMGISNNDKIVIYDNSDVISSCRCWYNFIYFGHNQKSVHILDGGIKKWKLENRPITNEIKNIKISTYKAFEKKELVKSKKQIDENIKKKEFIVVDARSRGRFEGKEPEPRKELRSGSIPDSFCLPFKECINEDHSFKNKEQLSIKFKEILGSELPNNLVFSCGSGITAAVLSLAYSVINDKYLPTIYDGSWAEYGRLK
tara:strand:- start:982 stop:1800 length:819 start_codon:yes stop_codon:yes gene_type:complete